MVRTGMRTVDCQRPKIVVTVAVVMKKTKKNIQKVEGRRVYKWPSEVDQTADRVTVINARCKARAAAALYHRDWSPAPGYVCSSNADRMCSHQAREMVLALERVKEDNA
jgi:hypothetical protein